MSTIKDIENKISALLANNAKIDLSQEQFDTALHLDSLAMLELILGLEKEYELEVDESELDLLKTFNSVSSIARFVLANADEKNN
jgi:acyl carrier protein